MEINLSEDEIIRYSRNILLDQVSAAGQQRLKNSRVLVIGAGGLGAPLLFYLAAAGVGHIGIIDHDRVELSNLQRQVIHFTADIGKNKALSASEKIRALNPEIKTEIYQERLTAENIQTLFAGYPVICDGTDNFKTRFLVADTAYRADKTLITAAIAGFEGQIAVFKAKSLQKEKEPCWRCLYPEKPPEDLVPPCAEAGVLGAAVSILAGLQATETLKFLLGIEEGLSGKLLLCDLLRQDFRRITLRRRENCALCGTLVTKAEKTGQGKYAV